MPNVNMGELRSSLKQCVRHCREHRDRDYSERHLPILVGALEELQESNRETDRHFANWRAEQREQRQAWKALSKELREVQEELDRVNAVGFPDQRVLYWDEEILEDTVRELIDYLEGHSDDIEFAADLAEKLERKLEKAAGENEDQQKALRVYQSKIKKRSEAMGDAIQALSDFRSLLRDELGADHEEYNAIRWPYGL